MRIDSHLHLYPTRAEGQRIKGLYQPHEYGGKDDVATSARGGDVEEALEAIAEAGAAHAIALTEFELPGNPWPPSGRFWPDQPVHVEHRELVVAANERTCAAAAAHPELIAFVGVHPAVFTPAGCAAHVVDLVECRGARGMKFHTIAQRLDPADPALWPTYALCAERGLPIVAHCGPDRHRADLSTPAAFVPVAAAFPALKLVLAHLGGGAWRDLAPVAAAYPGLRFDLSEIISWAGAPLAPTEPELVALIRTVGVERVLMGSDFPWYDPAEVVARVEALPGLGDDERARILGANAVELLGL